LTRKLQENNLIVLNDFQLARIRTKEFIEVMSALNLVSTLIVTEQKNDTLERSSRNVPYVKVLRSEGLNTYDILKYKTLLLLESSIKTIERRLLV
jgi:large subunit ribosomal protein L4